SLIPVIKEHTHNDYTQSAYELSSYGSTYDFLKRHFANTTASEYMPGEKLGERINGIFNQDVQQLTFADATFDIVTSNQVFEHVPDDVKVYAECLRVLRPGGGTYFCCAFIRYT
ncbi:MAG: class I SAM-dependent methyltransferase, partial [Flammeovirgaceae bacterium]